MVDKRMIDVVVITQNQSDYILDMIDCLMEITGKVIFVLDRCTDDTENLLQITKQYYVKTDENLQGRQTSYARNLGLSHCNSESDVLFLDGDRYLIKGLFDFTQWDKDIALLKLEDDARDIVKDYNETCYGTVHNGFYSCGLFMKREAIEKVKAFQNGELFKESIQDQWGIEDIYLGDVCYHLGLTCDIHPSIRLQGQFTKNSFDNLDVIEKRFRLRDKLNVKW